MPLTSSRLDPDQELEEKNILALVKRVLCSRTAGRLSPHELLPALSTSTEVDLHLYGLIALSFREFIHPWYLKVSPDHEFTDELILLFAHCIISLEQRVRRLDFETLLLDEIPKLLDIHIHDYRTALERQSTAIFPYATVNDIFHGLQPHPALSSHPESEHIYLKLLSSEVIAVLFPPEDLESDCERILLREILANSVFSNVVDRLSEPHVLFELVTLTLTTLLESGSRAADAQHEKSTELMELLQTHTPPSNCHKPATENPARAAVIFSLISLAEQAPTMISSVVTMATKAAGSILWLWREPQIHRSLRKKNILHLSVWGVFISMFSLDKRQPWLLGLINLSLSSFQTKSISSLADSWLSCVFQQTLIKESTAIRFFSQLRKSLFPNGNLVTERAIISEQDKAFSQKVAELTVWNSIPETIRSIYLSRDKEEQLREIGESLAFLRSRNCNKHLVYRVLDLLAARLIPELV